MFHNFTSQLAGAHTDNKKAMSPSLRPDIYSLIDTFKPWAIGGAAAGGQAGDSVSYGPILALIQKHLPETKKLGFESFGQPESEIAAIAGGITNMILELSKWEGMAAGMAMRTWVDAMVEAHSKASSETRKALIARGVTRGLTQYTDVTLLTKDFTTRIQILSCLKTVHGFMALEPTRPDNVRLCGARSLSDVIGLASLFCAVFWGVWRRVRGRTVA